MLIRLIEIGYLNLREVFEYAKKVRTYLHLKKDIYIEIWDEVSFYDHFEYCKDHPIHYDFALNIDKTVQGVYTPSIDHREQRYPNLIHNICIIDDNDWKRTLIHEMVHARQFEDVGWMIWTQCADIYEYKRMYDPFEVHASSLSIRILNEIE